MHLEVGDDIGDYTIERLIGTGAYGEVWAARSRRTGRVVAMKTLRASSKDDPETIRRFRKEAHFLESIESKYVARLLDFVTHERGMMLIMEYVEGRLLSDVFEQGPISVEHAIRLGIDLASGVRDLHAAGITHRDIKPQNLILRPMANGGVRATIIDFGLSRFDRRPNEERRQRGNWVSDSLTGLTRSDSAMGSLPYMAPEQLLDARKAREPADIYALGVILYQAACGHVPLGGNAKEQAKKKIIEESPRLPLDRHDDVARAYADLCARALRRRPVERFASADEMLQELTRLAAATPATASFAAPAAAASYDEGEPTTVRQPVASPSNRPPAGEGGGEAAALKQTLDSVMNGPRVGGAAPAPLPAAGAPPPAARNPALAGAGAGVGAGARLGAGAGAGAGAGVGLGAGAGAGVGAGAGGPAHGVGAGASAGVTTRGAGVGAPRADGGSGGGGGGTGSGGAGGVPAFHDADGDDSAGGTARMAALATPEMALALAQHGPAVHGRRSPMPPPVAGPPMPSGAPAWTQTAQPQASAHAQSSAQAPATRQAQASAHPQAPRQAQAQVQAQAHASSLAPRHAQGSAQGQAQGQRGAVATASQSGPAAPAGGRPFRIGIAALLVLVGVVGGVLVHELIRLLMG